MDRPLRFVGLVACVLLARSATNARAGSVEGTFALSQPTYGVGEPILVEFTVTNGRSSTFSFDEGGDYRGTLRHERYSFRVEDAAGRDFTQDLWGNEGGEGRRVDLEPGETFRSLQLLSGWVHLLPPGRYRVHCARTLRLDGVAREESGQGRPSGEGATIAKDLSFEVTPYRKEAVTKALAAMHEREARKETRSSIAGVGVEWVLADLNEKFQFGIVDSAGRSGEFEKAVLAALPEAWDDARFVEYGLRANRNWLTPEKPEDFVLTFTARNNGTVDLPHRLGESTLEVDGAPAAGWPKILAALLAEQRVGPTLAPGSVATLRARLNDVLPAAGRATLVWKVRGVAKTVDVRFGR